MGMVELEEGKKLSYKDVISKNSFNLSAAEINLTLPNSPIRLPWTSSEIDKLLEKIEEHCSQCPFPLKSYNDVHWWVRFSFKINYVNYRIPMLLANQNLSETNRIKNIDLTKRKSFYLNDDFQRRAIVNHEINTNSSIYKQAAKEFIFHYNQDEDYFQNKLKGQSTVETLEKKWFLKYRYNENMIYAILDTGETFSIYNDIDSKQISDLLTSTGEKKIGRAHV